MGIAKGYKRRIRKWRGRKGRDMDLGRGKFWVGEWWEAGVGLG